MKSSVTVWHRRIPFLHLMRRIFVEHSSSDWYNHIFFCVCVSALFCDFITFLPFSHQVILPRGLTSWALALAAFFLEKCSQSSTCCHLCKLWPSFSYHCMCSCCMPLVTVRLFATNLESKFELFQGLSFVISYNTLRILFAVFWKLSKVQINTHILQ